MATKKIRIYELARELGVENQVVLDLADELKMGVKSHSSSIEDAMADRVRGVMVRRFTVNQPHDATGFQQFSDRILAEPRSRAPSRC